MRQGQALALHLHWDGSEQSRQPNLQGREALTRGNLKAPLPLSFLVMLGLHRSG
jgi:hypothetical protein